MTLVHRDRAVIWHPFTQEKTADLPQVITRGQGVDLWDETGKRYMDLISSWWVNLHGHSHPAIAQAICDQAHTLEHVIFAGITHEPAILVCEALQTLLPATLKKFFFSDNGSTAVEVALKMAHQYWFNQGETQRTGYISFEGGYHGDTFGAMAVGRNSPFHAPFKSLLFDGILIPFPATWEGDPDVQCKEDAALASLNAQLQVKGDTLSALILEPLVQGASGMRMCRPAFVQKVIHAVRSYNILVIYDEVMTGFGRLGTYFATDILGIAPDFICLSKGLTGGFLPLSLTVTTQAIYDVFYNEDWDKAFAHGHSYTANPIACRAALASFDLLVRTETHTSWSMIHRAHTQGLEYLAQKHPQCLEHFRCRGTIAAFHIRAKHDINAYLKKKFLSQGLLLRPLGHTLYILPPYVVTAQDLDRAYTIISDVIEEAKTQGLLVS